MVFLIIISKKPEIAVFFKKTTPLKSGVLILLKILCYQSISFLVSLSQTANRLTCSTPF